MPGPRSPFAWVDGKAHLIVEFDLEPVGDVPPLQQLLAGLLTHYQPEEILLLRPLGVAEQRLLERYTAGAALEGWAQMIVDADDRLRPRASLSGASPRAPRRRGRGPGSRPA